MDNHFHLSTRVWIIAWVVRSFSCPGFSLTVGRGLGMISIDLEQDLAGPERLPLMVVRLAEPMPNMEGAACVD